MRTHLLVAAYVIAIVAANLIATAFGPSGAYVAAFVLIGMTFTVRDALHDRWRGRDLTARIAALIGAGALISYAVNRNAGPVAMASLVAFAAAELTDTIAYHLMRRWSWLKRANGSNLLSSAVDSLVFPTIAFGGLFWPIVLGQFLAKVLGGFAWSVVLKRPRVLAAVSVVLALCVVTSDAGAQQKLPTIIVQAQAGPMFYKWEHYKPVGNIGVNAVVFLPKRFSVLAVVSRDTPPRSPWVGVLALQFKLWSR